MARYDICVLGGGTAGSAFAILMARRGARIALIEKTAFETPRCGEHLPPRARAALRALGCEAERFADCTIDSPGILTRWGGSAQAFKRYAGHVDGPGVNLTRHRFDAALFSEARRAGVTAHTRASLACAARVNGGWELSFGVDARSERAAIVDESAPGRPTPSDGPRGVVSLRADRVVDATGRASAFARRQGATWQCFGNLVAAVARLSAAQSGVPDDCCLFVDACAKGWWSVTPIRGALIATFYASADAKRRVALDPYAWWRWGLDAASCVRERIVRRASALEHLRMHVAFPRVLHTMYGADWFAIGDAAAAHDPLSGHGIVYALESAFRAAEMASAALPVERSGALYQEAIMSRFARHIENRELVYREGARGFPDSPFWREIDALCGNASAPQLHSTST